MFMMHYMVLSSPRERWALTAPHRPSQFTASHSLGPTAVGFGSVLAVQERRAAVVAELAREVVVPFLEDGERDGRLRRELALAERVEVVPELVSAGSASKGERREREPPLRTPSLLLQLSIATCRISGDEAGESTARVKALTFLTTFSATLPTSTLAAISAPFSRLAARCATRASTAASGAISMPTCAGPCACAAGGETL